MAEATSVKVVLLGPPGTCVCLRPSIPSREEEKGMRVSPGHASRHPPGWTDRSEGKALPSLHTMPL